MIKRSLQSRPLHSADISDYEIERCIDSLMAGGSVSSVPTRLQDAVFTTLQQQRKDAILHKKEHQAAKIDEILGEMSRGPEPYLHGKQTKPVQMKYTTRALPDQQLTQTSKTIVRGARLDSIDPSTRRRAVPLMEIDSKTEKSRAHYPKSRQIDEKIDELREYSNDSRRLGPHLLKIQNIEQKLETARQEYEQCRQKALFQKQQFDDIERDAKEKLEESLNDEMLEHGSHVPTTLPQEYSKFSGKTLNSRFREDKAAGARRYDEAAALHSDAVQREQEELERNNERFTRAFNLNRQHLLKKHADRREIFTDTWALRRDKMLHDVFEELKTSKSHVERLERELAEATKNLQKEVSRIKSRTTQSSSRGTTPTLTFQ